MRKLLCSLLYNYFAHCMCHMRSQTFNLFNKKVFLISDGKGGGDFLGGGGGRWGEGKGGTDRAVN